jgi:hypothetical protein
MQSLEKPARLKKADVTQLNQFLGDVAISNRRGKAASATERDRSAEMPQARNSQESDQHSEEWISEDDDDDDEYITIEEVDVDDDSDVRGSFCDRRAV